MTDIKALKEATRLEDVIEESGYKLDRKPGERYWQCVSIPELSVDIGVQRYFWGKEKGDVINWICLRFNWNKGKAIRYLENRLKIPEDKRPRRGIPINELIDETAKGPSIDDQIENIGSFGIKESYKAFDFSKIKDPVIFNAVIRDTSGFLLSLWQDNYVDLERNTRWIPLVFSPIIGYIDGISECCAYCLKEFSGEYKLGKAFFAYEYCDKGAQLVYGGQVVYCGDCVQKLLKWTKIIDYMKQVKLSEMIKHG